MKEIVETTFTEAVSQLLAEADEYFRQNRFGEAEQKLLEAYSSHPTNFDTLFQLSKFYYTQKNYVPAEKYLLKTVAIQPGVAGIFSVLGIVQKELGKYQEAEVNYVKALQINPLFSEAYYNLGLLYHHKRNIVSAVVMYQKAVELNPQFYLAYYNCGNAYRELEQYDEAEKYYNHAIDVKSDYADAYYNLGVLQEKKYNHESAFSYYTTAIQHNEGHTLAHWNRSLLNLLQKNYKEGFAEYEWRKKKEDFPKRKFSKPELISTRVEGKVIFVYDDQGAGDAIQFVRYLKQLKSLGAKIIFECDSSLLDLMTASGVADAVVSRPEGMKNDFYYDFHISLLSLPHLFGTVESTIPSETPYIQPYKKSVSKFITTRAKNDNLKVGVAWAGNPYHSRDQHRSIDFQLFSSLFAFPHVEFYSLQKFIPGQQIPENLNTCGLILNELNNFEDTAALIQKMDLVISVDTSVAHLAGALGKEVWTLIYYYPDWRWRLEGDTTPWYPTMKLFRQQKPLEWNIVIEKVTQALKEKIEQRSRLSSEEKTSEGKKEKMILYTALAKGDNFGWGVCSNYLRKELAKHTTIIPLNENASLLANGEADGIVLHALIDLEMHSLFQTRGKYNIGYAFFEYELTLASIENIKAYDVILVGSTWCKTKLEQAGVTNVEVVIQGIDPEVFYPVESELKSDFFKIFSGGKFELRKGQDIVLKAIKILQQKYSDIILVNAWYNFWPETMNSMKQSPHIAFELKGDSWDEYMKHLYVMNQLDAGRIMTFPLVANQKSRELYRNTDLGIFPNRAEGGTNLVLMEYMACGKPVVATYTTGHTDIITEKNSLPLTHLHDFKLYNDKEVMIADWREPDMDELIAAIEYAYFHRDETKKLGRQAAAEMKYLTWQATAENIMTIASRFQ